MVAFSVRELLTAYLNENEPRLVYFLVTFWHNQERAITYKELREAILNGELSPDYLEQWQQDYSLFVTSTVQPMWLAAAGKAVVDFDEWLSANRRPAPDLWFDPVLGGIEEWVTTRAADFVTRSTKEQMAAIQAVVGRAAMAEDMNVDQLARAIRAMVGLTERQAVANMKYYENLIKNGLTQKRALELQVLDAARKHRYRGYNIARTELAFAYNKGADSSVRQAQEHGFMGDCVKEWSAVIDDRTCDYCKALNGTRIAMDEEFEYPTRLAATNPGIRRTPPAHPSCRCGVKYVEVTEPIGIRRGREDGV